MTIEIVPLSDDQWAQAGAMMGRAFEHDPARMALFPDPATRSEQLRLQFQMGLRQAVVDGFVIDTTRTLSALAVWVPPGHSAKPSMRSVRANLPLSLRWVRLAGVGDVTRSTRLLLRYSRMHDKLMPQEHWYLEMLGVDPSKQGLGVGAALVRHGVARADADELPAFVETETAANAAFYAKFGFRTLHYSSAAEEPLGVPTWRLRREPRSIDICAPGAGSSDRPATGPARGAGTVRVRQSLVIAAAPDVVFGWIEDPARARLWQPDVAETSVLHAEPGLVGTTFREVLKDGHGQAVMEGRVTEFSPGRALGMRMHGAGMTVTARYVVTQHPQGTLLAVDQTLTLPGRFTRLLEPVIRPRVAARARRDLERLKELCERETPV